MRLLDQSELLGGSVAKANLFAGAWVSDGKHSPPNCQRQRRARTLTPPPPRNVEQPQACSISQTSLMCVCNQKCINCTVGSLARPHKSVNTQLHVSAIWRTIECQPRPDTPIQGLLLLRLRCFVRQHGSVSSAQSPLDELDDGSDAKANTPRRCLGQ